MIEEIIYLGRDYDKKKKKRVLRECKRKNEAN